MIFILHINNTSSSECKKQKSYSRFMYFTISLSLNVNVMLKHGSDCEFDTFFFFLAFFYSNYAISSAYLQKFTLTLFKCGSQFSIFTQTKKLEFVVDFSSSSFYSQVNRKNRERE